MDRLSQQGRALLNHRNPREVLELETWEPVYEEDDTSTEILTSSPMRLIGYKRTRVGRPDIEIEPVFKQLKVTENWHAVMKTEYHNHPITNRPQETHIRNPIFFPRYISKRLPIPEVLISTIYNNYLNAFDRNILEGEHFLVHHTDQLVRRRLDITGASPASKNAFYISSWNMFDADPNSPQ